MRECNIFWNENLHLDQRYHRNIQGCRIETMSLEEFAEGKQKKTNFCQRRYVTFLVELTQILYIQYKQKIIFGGSDTLTERCYYINIFGRKFSQSEKDHNWS
jgi:hypothetical protein